MGVRALVKETFHEFSEDDCPTMAAALAYYTIFSLPPLLVLLVWIAGMFFGQQAAEGQVVGQLTEVMGEEQALTVQEMLRGAAQPGAGGTFATIASVVVLAFGATGVFMQLQSSMNKAWNVRIDPDQSAVKTFVSKRLLGFGMILVLGFLLLVSLVLGAVISSFGQTLAGYLGPLGEVGMFLVHHGVSLLIIGGLFAAMFKLLPDARIGWRDVWVGALVTAVLFEAGKFGISFYLGQVDMGSAYGAAGSLVVLLVWVYYASIIYFLGVEITQVWARRYGSAIVPVEGAVRVIEEVRYERQHEHGPPQEA